MKPSTRQNPYPLWMLFLFAAFAILAAWGFTTNTNRTLDALYAAVFFLTTAAYHNLLIVNHAYRVRREFAKSPLPDSAHELAERHEQARKIHLFVHISRTIAAIIMMIGTNLCILAIALIAPLLIQIALGVVIFIFLLPLPRYIKELKKAVVSYRTDKT